MNYRYKCDDKIIKVWVWNDNFHTNVSVYDDKKEKSFDRTIRNDEGGSFFTWNKNKIYLHDWIRSSMKELKERFEKNEWVTSDELCQAIMSDGIDKVRFIVLSDNDEEILCKIVEDFIRTVKENYKIRLVAVDENDIRSSDYYTMDMVTLIRNGIIKIV